MAKYNKKNLANGTLSVGINNSATTIVLQTGEGALMPTTPFYATLTPYGVISNPSNSEIVLVTNVTGDTLTVTRAQRSTTGKTFAIGDVLANGMYTQDLDDLTQDDIPDGSTYKQYSSTEKTKLSGVATGADVTSDAITAASAKTTPVDADTMPLSDSAASNVMKKVTWANIKATLKTYFDALTTTLSNKTLDNTNTLNDILVQGNASAPSTPASGLARFFGAGTGAVRPRWKNSSGTLESIITDVFNGTTAYTNTAKSPSAGGSGFYFKLNGYIFLFISGLSTNNSAWWFINWSSVGFSSAPTFIMGGASENTASPAGWLEHAGYTSGGGGAADTTGCSILTRTSPSTNSTNTGGVSMLVVGPA